ncbi:MAG: anti-sigma factor antagonist [Cyanobacteriota bacterium]|nr:anti-sigma factor antagonist [Cyanobacteriota bacterium]
MDVRVKTVDQVTLVELEGEIDGKTAPMAQEKIVPLTQAGGKMLLDMTHVTYMSSAGLRVLLLLYRQMTSNNGQIALVGLSEDIKDTMSVTGFLKFFTISDTVDSGLAALQS